jgi:hypothetical protein
MQLKSTSMMSNWIGGAHINRDKKGDPNGRKPIEIVPAGTQRDALNFVIENTFRDEVFGLTPDLLQHMVSDSWFDSGFPMGAFDSPWPVHDQIAGIQASALSQMLNPTTLRRVYDNELRVPADQDALTLEELVNAVHEAVWTELKKMPEGKFSGRNPAISNLRRNLQTEYLQRLFDLANARGGNSALKTIATLASLKLRETQTAVQEALKAENLDSYSRAHLVDIDDRIEKWLDSEYVITK